MSNQSILTMAKEKSVNIFIRFFQEVYYRLFALEPKISIKEIHIIGNEVRLLYHIKDKDKEKVVRFLKRMDIPVREFESKTQLVTSDEYLFRLKVVIYQGDGDNLGGICNSYFKKNNTFLSKNIIEYLLREERVISQLNKEGGFEYLCFPHKVSPVYSEASFCELSALLCPSFIVNTKQEKTLLEKNFDSKIGFCFREII